MDLNFIHGAGISQNWIMAPPRNGVQAARTELGGNEFSDVSEMFDPGRVLCAHGAHGSVLRAAVAPVLRKSIGATSVAVKIVSLQGNAATSLRTAVNRLTSRAVRGCPQLVRYVGAWPRPSSAEMWIVSELLEAGSARGVLASAAPSELEACVAYIIQQCLLGLQHLHNNGIAHGNVRASNILLQSPASVKLADYGIYEILRAGLSGRQCYSGARLWPPPEGNHAVTKAADIWALAVTCCELLDGPALLSNTRRSGRSAPRLSRPQNWSVLLNELISFMAVSDPRYRPAVDQLLTHRFIASASDIVLCKVMDSELARPSTPEERMVYKPGDIVESLYRSGQVAMRLPVIDIHDVPVDSFCGRPVRRRSDTSAAEHNLWIAGDKLKELIETGRVEDRERALKSSRCISKWLDIANAGRGFR